MLYDTKKFKKYFTQETPMFKQSLLSVAVAATLCLMPVQAQEKISGGVVKIDRFSANRYYVILFL